MKKALLTISAVLGLFFGTSAQGGPGEDNGLGIRLNVGLPTGTSHYLDNIEARMPFKLKNAVSFGLTLDNRWYVWHNNKIGAAIQARWLDIDYINGKAPDLDKIWSSSNWQQENEISFDISSIEGGFLGVGPMFTFYLNNDMAIDAYYNILPAFTYSKVKYSGTSRDLIKKKTYDIEEVEETYKGISVTHHIGAAFRYKIFQAGVEYRIGKFKMDRDEEMDEEDMYLPHMSESKNSFRINLGVKF